MQENIYDSNNLAKLRFKPFEWGAWALKNKGNPN